MLVGWLAGWLFCPVSLAIRDCVQPRLKLYTLVYSIIVYLSTFQMLVQARQLLRQYNQSQPLQQQQEGSWSKLMYMCSPMSWMTSMKVICASGMHTVKYTPCVPLETIVMQSTFFVTALSKSKGEDGEDVDLSTQFDEPPVDNTDFEAATSDNDASKTTPPPPQLLTSSPTRMKDRSILLKVPITDSTQSMIEFIPCETTDKSRVSQIYVLYATFIY